MTHTLKTMLLLLCMGATTMGVVSCNTAYHKETDEMIVLCEQFLNQRNLNKCQSAIAEINQRKLTRIQSDKVSQLDNQIKELKKQIEQEQIEAQRKAEQERRRIEEEKRLEEERKREAEKYEAALMEVIQLRNEVKSLIESAIPYRMKMDSEGYGSYFYQSARIEYTHILSQAIEKQKKAINIARNRMHDEELAIEFEEQLESLKMAERAE